MNGSGPRFRTLADLRAIPHDQWEDWILTDTVPWVAFSAERRVQQMVRFLLKVAARRIVRR